MTESQIAILISALSAGIASFALGWNIYRDVVLKAKVRVSTTVVTIIHDSMPERPDFISVKATNYGPGIVHILMIEAKTSPLWRRLLRKTKHAVIMYDYTNPLSAKLPKKLEVGETADLLLPYTKESWPKEPFTHIGVSDSFGRVHWAPRKQLRKVREQWQEKFEE